MKVDFLICGTQKGGTTALADYLRQHNELEVPDKKELHFFDDETIDWTRPKYEGYHDQFTMWEERRIRGEATPIYMYWEDCGKRILEYNASMKLVIILRNPIDRAYSHWSMELNRGNETLSFLEAIKAEPKRLEESGGQHRVYSYIDRGFYARQIKRMWGLFGKDSVLVLKQSKLKESPLVELNRISEFLGVELLTEVKTVASNRGKYKEGLDRKTKDFLTEVFEKEIREVEDLLGWDCKDWLHS